ncbi:MAG TPA: DNA N-6-adenine-methyltransferase [Dermatophilaceae bacterium]
MNLLGFKAQNHPQQTLSSEPTRDVDDYATHPRHFETYAERFGEFTLDVAAAAHNTKCERFFDRATDGLRQSWAGEHVWCNPPYSAIEPWVRKAWVEAPGTRGIVMLLPATRTEQKWWQRQVEPHRDRPGSDFCVEFLPGRMRFIRPGQLDVGPHERPPFGCCLLIWEGVSPP